MPVEGSTRVNAVLTNFAQLAQQDMQNFGYYRMFSRCPVEHRSDSWIKYSIGQALADQAEQLAPGEAAPEAHQDGSEESYLCKRYALKRMITEEDYDNSQNKLGPQRRAQIFTQQAVMIRLERIFAANFLATSKWSVTDQAGVASGPSSNQFVQWNASSGSTIISNIEAWKELVARKCGHMPNKIGLTPDVYAITRAHSEIKDYIKYTTIESATLKTLAKLFDVEEVVIVGGAVYNTAKEKATVSLSRAATGKVLLTYAPENAGTEDLTAGLCFAWNRKGKGLNKYGIRIKSWWNEDREVDFVQAEAYNDLHMVSGECGMLAHTVLG